MESPSGKTEKVKRGYRACLHCRSRKAKCDLGDIDAPSSPPCSRCRRESRECVFAPSRRGGNNAKRKKETDEDDVSPDQGNEGQSSRGGGGLGLEHPPTYNPNSTYLPRLSIDSHYGYGRNSLGGYSTAGPSNTPYPRLRSSIDYDPPSQSHPRPFPGSSLQDLLRSPESQTNPYPHAMPPIRASHDYSPAGLTDHSPYSGTGSTPHPNTGNTNTNPNQRPPPSRTPSPKRRRLHLNPPLHAADPSSIVVADMQNESDALQILALASGQAGKGNRDDQRGEGGQSKAPNTRNEGTSQPGKKQRDLADFALIKLGIVTADQVSILAEKFFKFHHHLFPMVPSAIIPRTQEQLGTFAHNERYLLAAIIIIASRHDVAEGMREVHDRSWAVMRGWLSDIQCLGAPPTIGLVEALLLLAENLPRDPARTGSKRSEPSEIHAIGFGEEVHGAENRQAWGLIGMAIRNAYGLGIDKFAQKLFPEAERTLELERARLAWTYCYLFDRHVSLRLGLAFWSRGPSLCFQGFSSSAQTGPAAATGNFPFLREIKTTDPGGEHPQDDLASLVQAYVELTQLMSNAHDCLYPNAARTRSLLLYGEYFKYLDELARSLDGFKVLWRQKKWSVYPLTDAVWAMFYYTQLYICAFSFQAHVERAAMRAEDEFKMLEQQNKDDGELARPPLSLFPRGAAASPDARYIFQSCDAARTLLHICVDSLHPGGALPYLPSRFLLWFTYAAIVLLKALYSGAMLRADHAATLKLIERLCTCFAECSKDEDHPAVRYGRQLEALKNKLSGLSDSTTASSPTGGHTVPLPPIGPTNRTNGDNINPQSTTQSGFNTTTPGFPYGSPAAWAFPVPPPPIQPVSFPYPSTPNFQAYVAPPHAQPLSDAGNLHPADFSNQPQAGSSAQNQNNLGFPILDDWFGQNVEGDQGGAVFGSLDLQDFWMKVGPGEAQGGFPFR